MKDEISIPKILFWVAVFISACIVLVVLLTKLQSCGKIISGAEETIIVNDPEVITRYEKIIQRDTVIKWHERILYKEVPAKIVYRVKIDSVFIDKIKGFDFMLGLEKKNTRLRIYAVNFQDSLLKEKWYENIGNDFTVYSKAGGVFVKSKLFYWEGISLNASYRFTGINYDDGGFALGASTGVNYNNLIGVTLGSRYNMLSKRVETDLQLNLKLIQ